MYQGYLCLGGQEIGNNARTRGYAESAPCPVNWFAEGDACEGLADALGDASYDIADIESAPWFDPSDESTSRFYGAYITSLGEISSSTRAGAFTEGIGDGGVPGATRHGGKSFRVRAWLTAAGEDALETGHSWLDAMLQAQSCGTHAGGSCGATDATFFTACPPERGTVPTFTPWVTQAENLSTNPSFEAGSGEVAVYENLFTNPSFEAGSGTVEVRRNYAQSPYGKVILPPYSAPAQQTLALQNVSGVPTPNGITTAIKLTLASDSSMGGVKFSLPVDAPGTYVVSCMVNRQSGPLTKMALAQPGAVSGVGQTFTFNLWTLVQMEFEVTAAHITDGKAVFGWRADPGAVDPAGSIFYVTEFQVAPKGQESSPPIEGDTPPADPDLTASWTGTPNASVSVATGVGVSGVTGGSGRLLVRSSQWGGSSLRIMGLNDSLSAAAGAVVFPVPAYAGKTLTVLATLRITESGSATVFGDRALRSIYLYKSGGAVGGNKAEAPNTPGEHPLRLTVTIPNDVGAGWAIRLGGNSGSADAWWDNVAVIEGTYAGPYFDGNTPHPDVDFTTAWTGAANASTTKVTGVPVAGVVVSNCVAIRSTRWKKSGAYSMRLIPTGTSNSSYAYFSVSTGVTGTALATVHLEAPIPGPAAPYARGVRINGSALTNQVNAPNEAGDHELRIVNTGSPTTVVLGHGGSAASGDVWYDCVGIFAGDYEGDWFDGDSDSGNEEVRNHRWSDTPHASTSIYETRARTTRPRTDDEYEPLVEPLVRHLHDVICISGPLEIETRRSSDGIHWGRLVEFTLYAGKPWLYGETKTLDRSPTPATVFQDTPFNLVIPPSAELAGSAVIAATNFSTNPSVEVNATGWSHVAEGAVAAAAVTSARVTGELAAAGTSSFRALFTATGASSTAGAFCAQQEVDISTRPAGSSVSISLWAASFVAGGNPVRSPIAFEALWRSAAGGTILRVDAIGTVNVDGGVAAAKSLVPPAGATHVVVRARLPLTSWDAGTIVRLYADALAVTVP